MTTQLGRFMIAFLIPLLLSISLQVRAQTVEQPSLQDGTVERLEAELQELRTILAEAGRQLAEEQSRWTTLRLQYWADWYDHNRQLMRSKEASFEWQRRATTQIHWLVLILVTAAAALSVFEILYGLAYRAQRNDNQSVSQELEVSANRVKIVTTVSGFVLLIATFAFFYVYIMDVYTLKPFSSGTDLVAPTRE